MDKSSFRFNASPYGSCEYIAEVDGLKIEISEKYFSDEVMSRLEKIVEKAREIASEVYVTDYNNKVA